MNYIISITAIIIVAFSFLVQIKTTQSFDNIERMIKDLKKIYSTSYINNGHPSESIELRSNGCTNCTGDINNLPDLLFSETKISGDINNLPLPEDIRELIKKYPNAFYPEVSVKYLDN